MRDDELKTMERAVAEGQFGAQQRYDAALNRMGRTPEGYDMPAVLQFERVGQLGLAPKVVYRLRDAPLTFQRVPGGSVRCPGCLHSAAALHRVRVHHMPEGDTGRAVYLVDPDDVGGDEIMLTCEPEPGRRLLVGTLVRTWPYEGLADVAIQSAPMFAPSLRAARLSQACGLCNGREVIEVPAFWLATYRAKVRDVLRLDDRALSTAFDGLSPWTGSPHRDADSDLRSGAPSAMGEVARRYGCRIPSVAELARAALGDAMLPTMPYGVREQFKGTQGDLGPAAANEWTRDGWLFGGKLYRPGWPLARPHSDPFDTGYVCFRLALDG